MLLLPLSVSLLSLVVSNTGIDATTSYQPVSNTTEPCPSKTKTLYLLGLAPFPDREYPDDPALRPGWLGGPAVISAAQVAVAHLNSKCDILEEYRVELLVSDSGCNIVPKTVVSIADILDNQNRPVAGIIGPSCTASTAFVGSILARNQTSLLHISPSATSPSLQTDVADIPNTFRTVGTSLSNIDVYAKLIQNFTNITIFFDIERPSFAAAAAEFQQVAESMNVTVQSFGMSDTFIPLANIKNRLRIVFVFSSVDLANRLMCLAYRREMIYPDYQYFFSYRPRLNFYRNVTFSLGGDDFNCTAQDMLVATNGSILTLNQLTRPDNETLLDSGVTTTQFVTHYEEALQSYKKELNLSRVMRTRYRSAYYDAVWVMASALNASIPRLSQELNATLSEYKFGRPEMTSIIRDELLRVNFEGVRGTNSFNKDTQGGEDVTVINVYKAGSKIDQMDQIGVYDPTDTQKLNLTVEDAFIPDLFVKSLVSTPIYVEAIVFLIVLVVLAVTVFFHIVNLRYNRVSTIRATTPALNNFIFLGCYLYVFSIICVSFNGVIGVRSPTLFQLKCIGFIWCESIALTLIYGTICVKTWRLLRIFSHSSAKMMNYLQTYRLALAVLGLVLLDIVINVIWNAVDTWYMHTSLEEFDDPRVFRVSCRCDRLPVWLGLLAGWKIILVVVVVYLALATRQIPKKEYKQTKATNSLVYVFIIVYALTVPTYIIFYNRIEVGLTVLSYLSVCLKNILCIVMCNVFIFLPPVLPHLKRRWNQTELSTHVRRVSRKVSYPVFSFITQ